MADDKSLLYIFTAIPIVFILFNNLASFLPASARGLSNNTLGASVVISSQVGERGYTIPSQILKDFPLSLNFSFETDMVNWHVVVVFQCIYCCLCTECQYSGVSMCVLELLTTVSTSQPLDSPCIKLWYQQDWQRRLDQ